MVSVLQPLQSDGCNTSLTSILQKILKASADAGVHSKARRCVPSSRVCLFVFVQSSRATEIAVDFVSSRGWNTSGQLLDEQER